MQDTPQTIDFRVYSELLRRWAWLIVLLGLLFGLVAYLISSATTPVYQASATLLIDNVQSGNLTTSNQSNYTELLYTQRLAQTYASLMMGEQIRKEVERRTGVEPDIFSSYVQEIVVSPVEETQLLVVKVTGRSPELIALVANTLPEVFIEEIQGIALRRYADSKDSLQEQLNKLDGKINDLEVQISAIGEVTTPEQDLEKTRLQNTLNQYQDNYVDLLGRFETIRLAEAQAASNIVVTDPAFPPTERIGPPVMTNTLLSAVIGAGLPLILISLLGYLDNSIGTPDKLRRRFNKPVLGSIPIFTLPPSGKTGSSDINLVTVQRPRDQVSEAYRILRTSVLSNDRNGKIQTLAVTSSVTSEGKSTTAANLAVVIAQSGRSVALIDADMRRPTLHQIFSITARPGLADTLGSTGDVQLRYEVNPLLPNLAITPAGTIPMNPSELIGSHKMNKLIENLCRRVDFVIFDTPPLLSVADAQILSGSVDGVLMVVGSNTAPELVSKGLEALQMTNTNLLGLLLNRMEISGAQQHYRHDYYARSPIPVPGSPSGQRPVAFDFDSTRPVETTKHSNGVRAPQGYEI